MSTLTFRKSLADSIPNLDSENTLSICPGGPSANLFFIGATQGKSGNLKVYQASLNDNDYDYQTLHAPGTAYWAPGLVNYNGTIYMFYREIENDDDDGGGDAQIYYRIYNSSDGSWSSKTAPNGMFAQTDHTPTAIQFNNQICLVYKENTHHFVGEAWMSSSNNWSTNQNVTYWDSDHGKLDWGYQGSQNNEHHVSDHDTYRRDQIMTNLSDPHNPGTNPCSPRNLAMTAFGSKLYMAFKGGRVSDDDHVEDLYIMTCDSNGTWSGATLITNQSNPDQFQSLYAPSLVAIGGKLLCFFSCSEKNDNLCYSVYDQSNGWSDPIQINSDSLHNGKSTDPLAVALDSNTLALSYVDSDKNCVLNLYDFS